MANDRQTDAEILAQIPSAREREEQARRTGLRAVSVRFDAGEGRVRLELSNGYAFAFPVKAIRALKRARPQDLARVELDSSGAVLQWDSLDVDLSVPGLLFGAVGAAERRRHLAKLAGSVSSDAKAEAARRNGAKGGRPRIRFGVDKRKVAAAKPKKLLVAAKRAPATAGGKFRGPTSGRPKR